MTGTELPDSLDVNLTQRLADSVVRALATWQASTDRRLTLDRWMTEGHTGAPVAVVLVSGPQQPPSKIILKACPPERLTSREPKLHAQALATSPREFASTHLVDQPFETIECEDKWRVLFQSIAGNSLRLVRPLSSILHDERLPEIIEHIALVLLRDWNPNFETRKVTPHELLQSDLGSKVDRNGPLTKYMQELGVADSAWIRFSNDLGSIVPNALKWALTPSLWPQANGGFWAHFGNSHGDLHPGNVLVQVDPTPRSEDFRLIDLSAYTPNGSLAKDPIHLCLSVIGQHLSEHPDQRRNLLGLTLGDSEAGPLEFRGLREIVASLQRAAKQWQSSSTAGLQDDWNDQLTLALVAGGLEFVGRQKLSPSQRFWYFQLSCMALAQFLNRHKIGMPPADPAAAQVVGPRIEPQVEAATEIVMDRCGRFKGTRSLVAVLAPDVASAASNRIGFFPWTAVMSFDPNLDKTGAMAAANQAGERFHRLVTKGQVAEFGHGSTTWLAFGGLSDLAESTAIKGLRNWRRAYRSTIDQSLSALARFSARPLTVVVFGSPDGRVHALVEALDDQFAERSQVIHIATGSDGLGDFADEHLKVEPDLLIEALPLPEEGNGQICTVPGHDGPVTLEPEERDWIRELGDLVDSAAGTTAGDVEDVGRGFLEGRVATWFELSLDLDVVPGVKSALSSRITEDLAGRDTRRISLQHYPGAGGTTLARRLAWEAHLQFPTLYCAGARDEVGLAQRVARLGQLTGLPVFVILEQTTDIVADRFYNRLRSDSVAAVVLVVSRRLERPKETGTRRFYLGPAANAGEIAALAQRFGEYSPERLQTLRAVRPGEATAVPFYFGLIAFQEQYNGLTGYVERSIADATDAERQVLSIVALSHRYGGASVAADLFTNVLGVDSDDPIILKRAIGESARALLVEDEAGFWRTAHWLVAAEALRQLLKAGGGTDDTWRLSLSGLALRVIKEARAVFDVEPPDDIRSVLERLFIIRENRELYGGERLRPYSELLEDIPSLNGRLQVLRELAENFATTPHYWAHYGRLLSYEGGDSKAALEALDRALALDERDSVLFHIRGMVYRRQLRDLSRSRSAPASETELLRITDLALADFAEAARLDDDSEYPFVAAAQAAVSAIETAYQNSNCRTYGEFLSRPSSAPYRSLLEQAETAIDAVSEIRGPDPMSRHAEEVAVSLRALYDDYSALLQGWRNLLDRDDVIKTSIRRRLVRAYLRRAGEWRQLNRTDRQRVLSLLEDNLRDDPTDAASLRDWLRAARSGGANLDRASELVTYWATGAATREALYYDYVIAVLQVVAGRESAWREAQRKIDRCRERSMAFGNRKFSYEWLGRGEGLSMLVHSSELPASWIRDRTDDIPALLHRMPARIASIDSPQAGRLHLEAGGLQAFFVPARAGAVRGRHENARVEAAIGFSYDGLRAWSVRIVKGSHRNSGPELEGPQQPATLRDSVAPLQRTGDDAAVRPGAGRSGSEGPTQVR